MLSLFSQQNAIFPFSSKQKDMRHLRVRFFTFPPGASNKVMNERAWPAITLVRKLTESGTAGNPRRRSDHGILTDWWFGTRALTGVVTTPEYAHP